MFDRDFVAALRERLALHGFTVTAETGDDARSVFVVHVLKGDHNARLTFSSHELAKATDFRPLIEQRVTTLDRNWPEAE